MYVIIQGEFRFQVPFGERAERHSDVKMFGNAPQM